MTIKKVILAIVLSLMCPYSFANGIAPTIEGDVFYFGFEISRITGIPESQIEEYGCRHKIDRKKFISLLGQAASDSEYDKQDIRAKVIFKNEEPYFISREGLVRHGTKLHTINKQEFVGNLQPTKQKCR